MIQIAILGVGWAGTRHVEAIRELNRKLSVYALIDDDPDHLNAKSAALGVDRTYPNLEAALNDPNIDAVSICTPHHLHCPAALAIADAGKHILCEKPIALTVAEASQMIDAADSHGVKLYVAENRVYTPMTKLLRMLVQEGKYLGELTGGSFRAGFQAPHYGYPGRRAWLAQPKLGGTGTWMLHGIHSMAQFRAIFGEVETVYLREHKANSFQRIDLEGTVSGLLTLESGVHISVMQTAETRLPGNLGGYIIHGDHGSLRAAESGVEIFQGQGAPLHLPYPVDPLSDYAQEMEAFADYVTAGINGPTSAAGERRSLAIVQAGYESIQSGQPINLQERFGPL